MSEIKTGRSEDHRKYRPLGTTGSLIDNIAYTDICICLEISPPPQTVDAKKDNLLTLNKPGNNLKYLHNRLPFMEVEGSIVIRRGTDCGVTQGSLLEPTLL